MLRESEIARDVEHFSREELEELVEELLQRERTAGARQIELIAQHERDKREMELYRMELELQNRELREAQRRLEDGHALDRRLYHSLPVAHLILSAQAQVQSFNDAALELLGFGGSQMRGADFVELVQLSEGVYFRTLLQRCGAYSQREALSLELRVGGKTLFVEAFLTALPPEGEIPLEFSCALIDRTEGRRLELERERIYQQERGLHERFELLDQFTFATHSAIVAGEPYTLECLCRLMITELLRLTQGRCAELAVFANFYDGTRVIIHEPSGSPRTPSLLDARLAQAPLLMGGQQIGLLRVWFGDHVAPFDLGTQRTLMLLSERVALTLELHRLRAFERAERARLALLARAHDTLGDQREMGDGLDGTRRAVALSVPEVARLCAMFVRVASGGWQLLIATHSSPEREPSLSELARRFARWLGRANHPFDPTSLEASGLTVDLLESARLQRLAARFDVRRLNVLPLRADQQTLGFVCFADIDTSESTTRTYRELAGVLGRALDRASLLRELRGAIATRDDLLAVVSHDLRSPINAIQLTARALERQSTDPGAQPHLELIQRATGRMGHLVEDLLCVASLDAGRLELDREAVTPGVLLKDALFLNAPILTANGHTTDVDCDEGLPNIFGDRQRLLQVLGNLICNAAKFTPRGGSIRLSAVAMGENLRLSVSDSGPGISPSALSEIFTRYWRGRLKGGGAGLGLYIADQIVKAHSGRIWAESSPGKGASFHFTIPAVRNQTVDANGALLAI